MRSAIPLLLAFLAFVPAFRSLALSVGPDEFRECPHCRRVFRESTILSGNSFGARLWTDGWLDAPMLPDVPPVARCGACGEPFWREAARRVSEPRNGGVPGVPSVETHSPRAEDYRKLLSEAGVSPGRQRILRTRLWWLANSARRVDGTSPASEWSGTERDNLEKLAALLDAKKPVERLRKVEILRELGRFDEAARLLEELRPTVEQNPLADRLRALIGERNAAVATVPPADPPRLVASPTNAVKAVKKSIRKPAGKAVTPSAAKKTRRKET